MDATAGNGRDTLFLAQTVGKSGRVWAFDIQPDAILQARVLLAQNGLARHVEFILGSHEDMRAYLPAEAEGRLRAIVFNLGYLPGGDKAIVTKPASTMAALEAGLALLAPGGCLSVIAYRGHDEGLAETDAVQEQLAGLEESKFFVEAVEPESQNNRPPVLFFVVKRDTC